MKIMIKKLTEIRNGLLAGVEQKDLLAIKFEINNIDTVIYRLSQILNGNTEKGEKELVCP